MGRYDSCRFRQRYWDRTLTSVIVTWDRRTLMMALVAVITGRSTEPVAITRDGFVQGVLTVNLDQWRVIRVQYEGKTVELPPHVIYDELVKP